MHHAIQNLPLTLLLHPVDQLVQNPRPRDKLRVDGFHRGETRFVIPLLPVLDDAEAVLLQPAREPRARFVLAAGHIGGEAFGMEELARDVFAFFFGVDFFGLDVA